MFRLAADALITEVGLGSKADLTGTSGSGAMQTFNELTMSASAILSSSPTEGFKGVCQ
jgi:hypothetical protein